MYRLFLTISLMIVSLTSAHAGIDDAINDATAPIAELIGQIVFFKIPVFGAQLPVVCFYGWSLERCFFTFYMGFINLRGFKHAIALVRGDYADPNSHGEVSHFQALATAVSGTVGIGNIGGVAVAVTVGGPGATFWLILAGFSGHVDKICGMYAGASNTDRNLPTGMYPGGRCIIFGKDLQTAAWLDSVNSSALFMPLAFL